jgi:hypothetical protein
MTSIAPATTAAAPANPSSSINATQSGMKMMPPTLAPLKARLIAKPRRRLNQGVSRALIAALLVADHPAAVNAAAAKSCHGASAQAQPSVPAEKARTPARVVAARPKRRCASSRQATMPELMR